MADTIKLLSLCSGVGMLDEGVALGLRYLGQDSRVVGYCERDSFAAACLLARMEESSLEPAPVWCGNLEDVAWGELCGHVDWITAGFPCQPHSTAGKRKSTADERWIWPAIADAIRQVRPRCGVFLENVPGLLSSGDGAACGEVFGDLAEIGFDADWTCLPAAEVGASHRRERVFILAYDHRHRWLQAAARKARRGPDVIGGNGELGDSQHGTPGDGRTNGEGSPQGRKRRRVRRSVEPSGVLADAECTTGYESLPSGRHGAATAAAKSSGIVANASGAGQQERRCVGRNDGTEQPAAERNSLPVFAAGPSDPHWPAILESAAHLAPAIESGLRVLVDGLALVLDASRADQLRCGGNGVVALQSAAAFVGLVRRVIKDNEDHAR